MDADACPDAGRARVAPFAVNAVRPPSTRFAMEPEPPMVAAAASPAQHAACSRHVVFATFDAAAAGFAHVALSVVGANSAADAAAALRLRLLVWAHVQSYAKTRPPGGRSVWTAVMAEVLKSLVWANLRSHTHLARASAATMLADRATATLNTLRANLVVNASPRRQTWSLHDKRPRGRAARVHRTVH